MLTIEFKYLYQLNMKWYNVHRFRNQLNFASSQHIKILGSLHMLRHRVIISLFIIFILNLLVPSLLYAEKKQKELEHDLKSYIQYAVTNNPLIKTSAYRIKSQKESVSIAKKIADPKVTVAYFINEVETRVGPQKAKVGLSQMLPWPGKIKSKRIIQNSLLLASEKNEIDVTSNVISSVRSIYAKLYLTGQSINISKENLKLLKQLESILLTKYSIGTVNQAALIKIQVEISLVEDKIENLRSRGIIEKEKLRSLLDLPQDTEIPFPDILLQFRISFNSDDINVLMNPVLQQKSFQRDARKEMIHLAKKGFAPDLMLMTDYVITDRVNPAMGNPKDNGKDPWVVGASINLPLTIGKKKSEIKKAQFELDAINNSIKNLENRVESDLVAAYEKYQYAKKREKLYANDLLPKAKHVLTLMEEDYKNGKASILDFIDAQRMVLNLDIAFVNEQVKRELATAEIDRLKGSTYLKIELEKQE